MAWIYLAESEVSLVPSMAMSGQSPIVKSTDILKVSCFPGWRHLNCRSRQYGMTCGLCEEPASQKSTLFMEDFHARTSVLLEMASAWEASEAVFSSTSRGLSKKQTQGLYFSKTSQQLELVASIVSSKHLPSSGMIAGGQLFQPKKLEPVTLEKDGSCLPTPCATEGGYNQGGGSGRLGQKKRMSLAMKARRGMLPTPMARDWKGPTGANRASPSLADMVSNYLNPAFVEELMGYRIGWTELKDWAMQWFRLKPEKRL